jgi:hypothetical protein
MLVLAALMSRVALLPSVNVIRRPRDECPTMISLLVIMETSQRISEKRRRLFQRRHRAFLAFSLASSMSHSKRIAIRRIVPPEQGLPHWQISGRDGLRSLRTRMQ